MFMKKLLVAGLFFVYNPTFFSQITNLGQPIGWNNKTNINQIPLKSMKGYNQTLIDAEDNRNDVLKDRPWRFGYKYNVNYTPQNAGVWTTLPNGDKLWQLAIECKNALTINILLENYDLPPNAHLHIYDFQKTNFIGAYTNKNNRKD